MGRAVPFGIIGVSLSLGCAHGFEPYRLEAPLWRDPDRGPFEAELEEEFVPKRWNELDDSVFRPVSQFFAVKPGGEAVNVNALDEVPDSSWFINRAGREPFDARALARGPCSPAELSGEGPWSIVGGKPGGADPGFVIQGPDGQRYLIKLDEPIQGVRTTVADVVASRIYHAAGFYVPCNSLAFFDRSTLELAADARVKKKTGEKVPLTWAHIEAVLAKAQRHPDGRYRAAASLYLDGRPLGPWRYHGLRAGDRNDIVPHEDRRELRASRLLAAWTDHSDQRDQNTLAMWIETSKGQGFVRHHLLDFGDCFGSLWEGPAEQARRREHAYWFGPEQMLVDYLSLGMIERPWDRALLGKSGLVFAYYGVDDFDPETWRPSFPNPAFGRMTERDAAWMARIIAQIDEAAIDASVAAGQLGAPLHAELVRILLGRRQAILARYLGRLSPLGRPELVMANGEARLCATDLAVSSGATSRPRRYSAQAWSGTELAPVPRPEVALWEPARPCVSLPKQAVSGSGQAQYWVIEVASGEPGQLPYPARFHLYQRGANDYTLVGLERPETFDSPG